MLGAHVGPIKNALRLSVLNYRQRIFQFDPTCMCGDEKALGKFLFYMFKNKWAFQIYGKICDAI